MPDRVVHCKKSRFNVYIGRPSPWGNPFSHLWKPTLAEFHVATRQDAVDAYRDWLMGTRFTDVLQDQRQWILDHIMELDGMVLGCWCAPQSCHGDVLLEILELRKAGKI